MSNKKKLTAAVLTSSLFAISVLPAFSQGYTPRYNANSYDSTASYQNYATPTSQVYSTGQQVIQQAQPTTLNQTQQTYQNYNGYQTTAQQPIQQMPNAYQQTNIQPVNQNYLSPLQGRVVTVPAGTTMYASTTNTISSAYTTVGDTISLAIGSPLYFNGVMIVPAGSTVEGNVVIAQKAGRAGKPGQLKIKFTNVVTPTGQRIPISGKIKTEDGTGILIGGTTKDRLKKAATNTAVGAGSGALFGTVIGAISGKTGKGAWSGTAIGAGLGAGKTVIEKGKEVLMPSGSQVDIQLDQPLTINPVSQY